MEIFQPDASLVPPGARVLAAVSSGADSMSLLWWLHSTGQDFIVAHINHDLHELRSGDCERDEAFVSQKCAALGIEIRTFKLELPRKEDGHINEVVARNARYIALAEMARQNHCSLVATGHTATDGLETALLNLMRGAGPAGWLGIAPRRTLEGDIQLIRPLWKVPRAATRQILRQNNWQWRDDASNTDPLFRRNRVRHEMLPLLGNIAHQHPDDLASRYVKNAELARDETQFLDGLARSALKELQLKAESDLLILDGLAFQKLDKVLQRRVLRLAAQTVLPAARDLESGKIEKTRHTVAISGKRTVWTWRKELRVEWTGLQAGNRLRFWRVNSI